jgi:hypothetical protein
MSVMLALIVFALSGVTEVSSAPTQEHTQCTDVFIVNPGFRFFGGPQSFSIVSFSVDGGEFTTKGKLKDFDWGQFKVCGNELRLRFRYVRELTSAKGPLIRDDNSSYEISLRGKPTVYFGLGRFHSKELSEKDGKEAVDLVNSRLAEHHNAPTGPEWPENRERYYGRTICAKEISERCP